MNMSMPHGSVAATAAPPTASVRSLWLAVAVLGAATLSLAGVLLAQTLRAERPPVAAVASTSAPEPAWQLPPTSAGPSAAQANGSATAVSSSPAPAVVAASSSRPQASAVSRPVASKARPVPSNPAPAGVAQPAVAAEPATGALAAPPAEQAASTFTEKPPTGSLRTAPVCVQCGVIESVTEVDRPVAATGGGALIGGVLGGIVGNQIGKGDGRAVATVLGAIGGVVAGNAVERQLKRERVYEVRVRMDDGTLRTLEHPSAPLVGSRVTLESGTLAPVSPSPASGVTEKPAGTRSYSTV